MQAKTALQDTLAWSFFHLPFRLVLSRLGSQGLLYAQLATNDDLQADPTPIYRQLSEGPPIQAGRFVATSGSHQVCRDILRHPDFGVMAVAVTYPEAAKRLLKWSIDPLSMGPIEPPSLLAIDGPHHLKMRRFMARYFTARRVADMRDDIEATCERLLDDIEKQLADSGLREFEAVSAYASRLPVAIIAHLLGVPDEDHQQLVDWGNEAAKTLDVGMSLAEFRHCKDVLREMHAYMDSHLRKLAQNPGDDLMSRMLLDVAAMPPAERPDPHEVRGLGLLVLGAGFETTVNLISNAIVNLDRAPGELARLQGGEATWDNAVEETLRLDPPVMATGRQALKPTSYDGRTLPLGYGVITVLAAANRDPLVFEDPERFDVTRANADQHLAFSAGAHFCLGAGLARLEAQVALPALYRRFPQLRIVGEPVRRETNTLRGYEQIRVSV